MGARSLWVRVPVRLGSVRESLKFAHKESPYTFNFVIDLLFRFKNSKGLLIRHELKLLISGIVAHSRVEQSKQACLSKLPEQSNANPAFRPSL